MVSSTISPKIVKFIKQIDCTHKGLGLPVLYGTLSILANKSVFYIAGRGKGKTATVRLIPDFPNTRVIAWDSFTLEGLDENIGIAEHESLVWKVPEFSTLSDYHRKIFLTVCSKIASDGDYQHITKRLHINISDCSLSIIIAIQPLLYSTLCNRYIQWENMSYDRFSKFLLLNPLRVDTRDTCLQPRLPSGIVPINEVKLGKIDLSKVDGLYADQASKGRSYLYARDYVKALTSFVGKNEVKQGYVDLFYDLFHPYLETFSTLQFAKDLESPIEVSAGMMKLLSEITSYNDGVRQDVLAKKLFVTQNNIKKYASKLIDKKLIRKTTKRGRKGWTKYHMCNKLENHFEKYRKDLL